jgi:hypothetical protein
MNRGLLRRMWLRMSGIQLGHHHLPLPTVLRAIITRCGVTRTRIQPILLIKRLIKLHCRSQARLYRNPIIHLHRNRSHSNILPISLRIQLKEPRDMSEVFH